MKKAHCKVRRTTEIDSSFSDISSDLSKKTNETPLKKLKKRTITIKQLDNQYIKHYISVNQSVDTQEVSEKEKNKLLKRCEKCKDFINRDYILFCQYCLDAYHTYCLSPPKYNIPANKESIICPLCISAEMNTNKKKKANDEVTNTICQRCNKKIIYKKTQSKCEKCHMNYHNHCFKANKIICRLCEHSITEVLKTIKLSNYLQPQNTQRKKPTKAKLKNKEFEIMLKLSKNSLFKSYLSKKRYRNEGKLKLPKSLSKKQKTAMQKTIYRALTVKNIVFCDDLVYIDKDCPAELNNSLLEPSIQKISSYNTQIFKKFKIQSRKGEYGPVKVIDDSIQKFVVQATDDIPMNTIICEYAGEVTLLRKKLFAENDSIMDLIRTPSSSTSLVICPEKYGNLARFLSGINNTNEQLKKKQNVYSLRVNIDNSIRIFLLAAKNIKKGEVLYYDYNAGGYNGYPTECFV